MIDMELPDKIYVTACSINSRYGNRFGCWTERECPGYAYIRKDAMLEWAKERYKAIENDNQLSDIFKQGVLYELHRVIARLEML